MFDKRRNFDSLYWDKLAMENPASTILVAFEYVDASKIKNKPWEKITKVVWGKAWWLVPDKSNPCDKIERLYKMSCEIKICSVFFHFPTTETKMKFVILASLFVISAIALPQNRIIGDAGEYEKIPDGFGGMKFVNVDEFQEIAPMFDVLRETRFLLYTRFNPTIAQELQSTDLSSLTSSHFSSARPTRVLIHGWQR